MENPPQMTELIKDQRKSLKKIKNKKSVLLFVILKDSKLIKTKHLQIWWMFDILLKKHQMAQKAL